MVRSRGRSDLSNLDDDPLTRAMAPPPNETAEERAVRLAGEKEAQLRSAAIDEEINRERLANKKNKCVRILLLGQSESGKSTTLKNFQLFHSDKAFKAERASWRAVVQLNVVKSIRTILDTMADVIATPPPDRGSFPELNSEHRALRMRLSPLQQVEEALLRRLSPAGSLEWEATHLAPVTNLPDNSFRSGNGANGNEGRSRTEIAVNSTTQWKNAFTRLLSANRDSMDSQNIDFGDPQDPGHILNACADDMISLWNDPTIRRLLQVKKIRLQEKSGFFLDELARVTSLKYVPTDDDILKARLKTLGVSEHRFTLKGAGNMVSHDWRVFDVGGARSNRAAWVPFFDNMDAIIFLAPISGFDETLAEDPNVNRLEDSILLWQAIIKNPLLKDTEVVLFLNKIDLFKEKLTSGVSFGHYVVSYGNRPNDFDSTSKYLIRKFSNIHKQFSPRQRTFYCHLTTVTDSKSTQHILGNVKDMVLRQNLMEGSLM